MMSFASPAIHAATRAVVALSDTVWVQSAPKGTFERIVSVANGILSLTALLFLIGLFLMAVRLRQATKAVATKVESIHVDLAPLIKRANAIADDVHYVTNVVRDDMSIIHETLQSANARLRDAIAVTESQLHDFSALLSVVQQEAEGAFISTAAAVRGVRTGASHFAGGGGPELASVESDDGDQSAAEDEEDQDNGNDGITDDDPFPTRGPRVIRRQRAPE